MTLGMWLFCFRRNSLQFIEFERMNMISHTLQGFYLAISSCEVKFRTVKVEKQNIKKLLRH